MVPAPISNTPFTPGGEPRRVRRAGSGCALLVGAVGLLWFGHSVSATSDPAPPESTEPSSDRIAGSFDVGGHSLYIRCEGTGSPTVVYMHGSITETGFAPHSNGEAIQSRLADDYRMCVYDRRNLGRSDTVDAVQTPTDATTDMHNLLAAAEVKPPYVLLGASFGGLLAYLYANTYPDEVVGMVLLDSPFPDEMSLEPLFPNEEKYEAFDAEDENESLERISHYDTHVEAAEFIGQEPAIPLTYVASLQEPWDGYSEIPEYDEQIMDVLAGFVNRFSPGELVSLDVPHFMEVVAAGEITAEIREVIALSAA